MSDLDTRLVELLTSLTQTVGRVEGKVDSIAETVDTLAAEVDVLKTVNAKRDGRNAVVSAVVEWLKPAIGVLVMFGVLLALRNSDLLRSVLTR